MKLVYHLLFSFIHYSLSEYMPSSKFKSHCEGANRSALIEQFFHVVFGEFHATPPICVCVQMCPGQPTYCYPNGCLKRDNLRKVDGPRQLPERTTNEDFMFVIDEKPDIILESVQPQKLINEVKSVYGNMRPFSFNNPGLLRDHMIFKKHTKMMPRIALSYNIRDQLRNIKSNLLKIENSNLSKNRWPLNRRILSSNPERRREDNSHLVGKSKFFTTFFTDRNIVNYPPKYFKRDIKKTTDDDAEIFKALSYLDSDTKDFINVSLEALIENLINTNFDMNLSSHGKQNQSTESDLRVIPLNFRVTNNETNIVSVNLTEENVQKNLYSDESSKQAMNGMISNLAKRIDKQNNATLEMVKLVVRDYDIEISSKIDKRRNVNEEKASKITDNIIENNL